MNNNILLMLGTQFNYEGKKQFINFLANQFDYVAITGININSFNKSISSLQNLNIIPYGVIKSNIKVVLTSCVVLDLPSLVNEIQFLKTNNINTDNIFISDEIQLMFDFNTNVDKLKFKVNNSFNKNEYFYGLYDCYTDKNNGNKILVKDLFDFHKLLTKIQDILVNKNTLFSKYQTQVINPYTIATQYYDLGIKIKSYVTDTQNLLNKAALDNSKILITNDYGLNYESNLGFFKNINPNLNIGSILINSGIGINQIKRIFGAVKAFVVRNDKLPIVTEIQQPNITNFIKQKIVNGTNLETKPIWLDNAKIGWLDLFSIKYFIKYLGINEIGLTDLNCLTNIAKIKVCIGYQKNNQELSTMTNNIDLLDEYKPIYKEFNGWSLDLSKCTDYDFLPDNTKTLIEFIEEYLENKIRFISVGNDHNIQMIIKNN